MPVITSHFIRCLLLQLVCAAAVSGAINRSEAVSIGGIQQWINIKGLHDNDPLLLFLHGGPGNSVMGYADKFTGELQKYFVVVQWDQRGSGKTVSAPPDLRQMEQDAEEMIRYLLSTFNQKKIYLMGHSWGGFLALFVSSHYPELVKSCLAVSPMVNQWESERQTFAWMQDEATAKHNTEALGELRRVRIPFENGEHLYYHRKWLALFSGLKPPAKSFVVDWAAKWLPLYKEAASVNLFQRAPEIRCPVFFFAGAKDRQTYFKLTEDYYKAVKAEKKDLFWFTDSGHSLNLTEPKKLQDIIISLRQP